MAYKKYRVLIIVLGLLGICVLAPPLNVAFSEPALSFYWHFMSRGLVSFQGYELKLPFLWRPGGISSDKLQLWRALYNGGHELLTIEAVGDVINQEDAFAWQQARLSALNQGSITNESYVPDSIDSEKLKFVCVQQVHLNFAATMLCRVPSTNWHVSLIGDQSALLDARNILKSSKQLSAKHLDFN